MWQTIYEHDHIAERFRLAAARGRVGGTYLFVGPDGVGKRSMAIQLAKALLCENDNGQAFGACGECRSCRLVDAENKNKGPRDLVGNHPDLHTAEKRKDKQVFSLDILIGEKEKRNKEGLLVDMALKPAMSSRKIAVIDDADLFNPESANALLKTLEEPPPGAVIFLIGTSQNQQLPTIRSRSQIVRFGGLSDRTVADLLTSQAVIEDPALAAEIATAADGSISRATHLAEEGLWQFRGQVFHWLSSPNLDCLRVSRAIAKFVDAAGKESKVRRARLRQIVHFAIDFYRYLLRTNNGASPHGDARLRHAVDQALATTDSDRTLRRLDCCLETLGYLGRNVNQSTLIDWWIDELA